MSKAKAAAAAAVAQADLSALDQFIAVNRAEQLCHDVVNHICGQSWSGLGVYASVLPAQQLEHLVADLESVFRGIASLSVSKDGKDPLDARASASDGGRKVLSDVIAARRPELHHAALESVARISSAHLADFDWKNASGDKQNVQLELSLEELDRVVHTLEGVNRARLDLKS